MQITLAKIPTFLLNPYTDATKDSDIMKTQRQRATLLTLLAVFLSADEACDRDFRHERQAVFG